MLPLLFVSELLPIFTTILCFFIYSPPRLFYNKKTHFILIHKDEMGFRGTTLIERACARSALL